MCEPTRPETLLGLLLDAYWTSLASDPVSTLLLTALLSLGGVLVVLLRHIVHDLSSQLPRRPPAGSWSRRSIRARSRARSSPIPVRVAAIPTPEASTSATPSQARPRGSPPGSTRPADGLGTSPPASPSAPSPRRPSGRPWS